MNQETLKIYGVKNSVMVHQGIDLSRFNPVQVPRLIKKTIYNIRRREDRS